MVNCTNRNQGDPITETTFTNEVLKDFETVCTRIINATVIEPTDYVTVRIVNACFKIVNLIYTRQKLNGDELRANSAQIIRLIDDDLSVLQDSNFHKTFPPYTSDHIIRTLNLYKQKLTLHSLLLFVAWLLAFEYEIAIKYYLYNNMTHYLLLRIKQGYRYAEGFSFWCGSTDLEVIFKSINIDPYEEILSQCLPCYNKMKDA